MLPKPEKKSKKAKNEQLDLVAQIDEKKICENKRRWLFVTIFFTIGLSFIFYTYRHISKIFINFQNPFISNNFKKTSPKTYNLNSVNQMIKNDKNVWSLYVQGDDKNYSINIDNPQSIIEKFKTVENNNFDNPPEVFSSIPKGLKFKFLEIKDTNIYEISAIIYTPSKILNIYLKVFGSNNFQNSGQLIPKVLDDIYWQVI